LLQVRLGGFPLVALRASTVQVYLGSTQTTAAQENTLGTLNSVEFPGVRCIRVEVQSDHFPLDCSDQSGIVVSLGHLLGGIGMILSVIVSSVLVQHLGRGTHRH